MTAAAAGALLLAGMPWGVLAPLFAVGVAAGLTVAARTKPARR